MCLKKKYWKYFTSVGGTKRWNNILKWNSRVLLKLKSSVLAPLLHNVFSQNAFSKGAIHEKIISSFVYSHTRHLHAAIRTPWLSSFIVPSAPFVRCVVLSRPSFDGCVSAKCKWRRMTAILQRQAFWLASWLCVGGWKPTARPLPPPPPPKGFSCLDQHFHSFICEENQSEFSC